MSTGTPYRSPRVAPKPQSKANEKLKAFHDEAQLGKAYDKRLLLRLWPFLKPHRSYVVISLAVLIAITLLGLLRPLVMGDLVRQADLKNASNLFRDGFLLVGLLLVGQALTFAQSYSMQLAGARTMGDLREHIFQFYQKLSLRYFDRTPIGRLVTRCTNDVDALGELFASGVLNAVGDLLSLLGIVTLMLILDWRLSLISFAALPFVWMLVMFMRKRSREAFREIRAKTARLNAFLNEQVIGISVVQAYCQEEQAHTEFDEINRAYLEANKQSIFYEAVLDAAIEMVSVLCVASILWWAGLHRFGDWKVTFATVVIFTQYLKQFFEPISTLSQRYTVLQSAMSGAERIFELLDEAELEPTAAAGSIVRSAEEALALSSVTFGYKKDVPILHDVSLTIKPGEKIALVGATGAGKTTVSALLLRLYDPWEGLVRVHGRDVKTVDRESLRREFSVVPQDVFLFAGSIASNIAMGDASPNRDRIVDALRRIGAYDIFAGRDGGLDGRVEDRGSNFSVGERQLLAFARAIYRDAPILILDEATANVDSDTEQDLQKALEATLQGRTALIIAHRLSTIRTVDRIVVFHKGRIVENGSHDELLQKDGAYARLHALQFAKEETTALGN